MKKENRIRKAANDAMTIARLRTENEALGELWDWIQDRIIANNRKIEKAEKRQCKQMDSLKDNFPMSLEDIEEEGREIEFKGSQYANMYHKAGVLAARNLKTRQEKAEKWLQKAIQKELAKTPTAKTLAPFLKPEKQNS